MTDEAFGPQDVQALREFRSTHANPEDLRALLDQIKSAAARAADQLPKSN